MHSVSTIHVPHCALVIMDEPILTGHYHPKPTVYVRVHSCCIFCGLGQTGGDAIYHYGIIQNSVPALKNLLLEFSFLI